MQIQLKALPLIVLAILVGACSSSRVSNVPDDGDVRKVLDDAPYVVHYDRKELADGLRLYRGMVNRDGVRFNFALVAGRDASVKVDELKKPLFRKNATDGGTSPGTSTSLFYLTDTETVRGPARRKAAYDLEFDLEQRLFATID
jgi:hypothetical protein